MNNNTSSKNATLYYAIKNAISNVISPNNDNYIFELKTAINSHTIPITEDFWIESHKYATKVISKYPEKVSTLNFALGYVNDGRNEDLILDATVRLCQRYDYLLGKFLEHTINCESEEETIKKFNGVVALIIPSLLTDLYRRVSENQEYIYEDVDILTSKKTKKTGNGLGIRKTLLTTSIDKNNSSNTDDEVTLKDTLISKEISAEERLISRENIMEYLTPIVNSPRELLAFMSIALDISADDILNMKYEGMKMIDIFTEVCSRFSIQYDLPILTSITNSFTTDSLIYSGTMYEKKQLSQERYSAKQKVKKYILDKERKNK